MFGSLKRTAAVALSVLTLASVITPAQAMPLPTVQQPQPSVTQDVQQVQFRRYYRHGGYRGYHRGYRGDGYRYGYRRHNNAWVPLAAFGAGALIGGALAAPAPRYYERRYYAPPRYYAPVRGLGPRHVSWCENRYRSYRAYDNTFQPNYGPRRQCLSPYS